MIPSDQIVIGSKIIVPPMQSGECLGGGTTPYRVGEVIAKEEFQDGSGIGIQILFDGGGILTTSLKHASERYALVP